MKTYLHYIKYCVHIHIHIFISMNWLEKYRPLYLKDLRSNKEETDKCIKWIKDYKKDCKNTKRRLANF